MSQAFSVQLCRIVTPEKLSDRFLSSGVLYQKESNFIGDQVLLLYIFEIAKPWFPSSKVIPALLETLDRLHPTLKVGAQLGDQFELVLRAVNEQLNLISETGETDWIGNLNGLIMAISGNQLHFSQTGHSPAYLLQKNRIRQITDDTANEGELHPLKTFSNLASGDLQDDDYILVSNQELYKEISLDALRRIINNHSPYQACQAIAKELKKQKNPAVAPLIFHTIPRGEAENKPSSDPHEIILADELQSPLRKIQKKVQPIIKKAATLTLQAGKKGFGLAKNTAHTAHTAISPYAAKVLQKGTDEIEKRKIKKNGGLHLTSNLDQSPIVEIINAPNRDLLPKKVAVQFSVVSFKKWWRTYNFKRQTALAFGILLLLLTIYKVTHPTTATQQGSTDAVSQTLSQADTLINTGTTDVQNHKESLAIQQFNQASQKLNGLTDLTPNQQTQSDQLWQKLTNASDALSKTSRLSVVSTYSFSQSSSGLITSLPYFYGFGTQPSLLRTGKGDTNQTQKSLNLKNTTDSIASLVGSTEQDTIGYFLTHQNKVYRITQTDNQSLIQELSPASGDFATGDTIGTYLGNIYILDGKSGLLWKYTNTGTTYSKGISIIDSSKYDIKRSLSLAIDGSIYILKQDGSITKFTNGQIDKDFSVQNVPEINKTLIQPLQIITDESLDSIYLLDAGTTSGTHSTARILELDKNGLFLHQYAFPSEYTRVTNFDIDPKQKKIWLLNNGKVSEFNF